MDLKLAGKTALVTGASKGIGHAIARALANEGCNLILVARGKEEIERACADLAGECGVSVTPAAADFSRTTDIEGIARRHPAIDILVNNAGAIGSGDLFSVSDAQWREWWDLKVFGYIHAVRTFYPLMRERGGGVIVNILGAGANNKPPAYICGATANAALEAFTRSLGSDSHKDGIRVVGIHPGAVETERMKTFESRGFRIPRDTMPFGRPAAPAEIANCVAFLASDASSYTSGAVITIDGGWTASGRV